MDAETVYARSYVERVLTDLYSEVLQRESRNGDPTSRVCGGDGG
jgi:hypothetical protein